MNILKKRLETKGITLKYDKKILGYLAKKSFAPEQGARLIRKNIQDLIEKKVAKKLLASPLKKSLRLTLKGDTVLCT